MMRLVKHVKRGSSYLVAQVGELQSSKGSVEEGETLVVYVGLDDGKCWIRPKDEFDDGRFVPGGEFTAAEVVTEAAQTLLDAAESLGIVLTIEQVPLRPLAMGHHETVVSVRPVRTREG